MMKFEKQYPKIERYTSVRQRIQNKRAFVTSGHDKWKEERDNRRKEVIGMIVLLPVLMVLLGAMYVYGYMVAPELNMFLSK